MSARQGSGHSVRYMLLVLANEIIFYSLSQGDSQDVSFSARSFSMARPGVAPPLPVLLSCIKLCIQGVALTGHNSTGPPWSVSRPTANTPGGRPARPPATLQTPTDDDAADRRQTPACKTILAH